MLWHDASQKSSRASYSTVTLTPNKQNNGTYPFTDSSTQWPSLIATNISKVLNSTAQKLGTIFNRDSYQHELFFHTCSCKPVTTQQSHISCCSLTLALHVSFVLNLMHIWHIIQVCFKMVNEWLLDTYRVSLILYPTKYKRNLLFSGCIIKIKNLKGQLQQRQLNSSVN